MQDSFHLSLKIFGSSQILEFQIENVQPILFLIIAPVGNNSSLWGKEKIDHGLFGDFSNLKLAWFTWLKYGDYQPRYTSEPLGLSVCLSVLM